MAGTAGVAFVHAVSHVCSHQNFFHQEVVDSYCPFAFAADSTKVKYGQLTLTACCIRDARPPLNSIGMSGSAGRPQPPPLLEKPYCSSRWVISSSERHGVRVPLATPAPMS